MSDGYLRYKQRRNQNPNHPSSRQLKEGGKALEAKNMVDAISLSCVAGLKSPAR
jgi:hypothetical protein